MSWKFVPVWPRALSEREVRSTLYRRIGLSLIGAAPIHKGRDEK